MDVWQAKMKTVAELMLVNLLTCLVGALAEVMVQMTVADMYFVHQRGLINTAYYWVTTFGSSLAPLAAGYVTTSEGWRWVWWWIAIFLGAGLIVFIFLYEETMFVKPTDGVVLDNEVLSIPAQPTSISDEKKDPVEDKSAATDEKDQPKSVATIEPRESPTVVETTKVPKRKTYWQILKPWSDSGLPLGQLFKHMYTPFLMMFSIPAIFFMSLEYGLMTACGTLTTTSLSSVMTEPPYNFSASGIGLMGLPSFIGVTLATLVCGPMSDYLAVTLAKRNKGVFEPEMRLWPVLVFALCVPAGLFMFGIGLKHKVHWIVPAIGYALTSFGQVPACSSALTYLTDSYTDVSISI